MGRLRRGVGLLAVVALVAIGGAAPAGAGVAPPANFNDNFTSYPITVNGSYIPLLGLLDCEATGDGLFAVIWYAPGSGADWRWTYSAGGPAGFQYTSVPLTVNGTYEPFVGDFNDDGCDDVFWYAPGSGADYVWYGTPGGGFETRAVTVNGDYAPLVGDWDDDGGEDDIFWYGAGGGTESIWLGSAVKGTFGVAGAPQVIATDFVTMSFGDGVLFYRPGSGADYIWEGIRAGATGPIKNIRTTINRTYEPHYTVAGWLLYGPGTAPDLAVYDYSDDGSLVTAPATINGTYLLATSSMPSNAYDIVFYVPGPGQDYLWYG